MAPVCDILTGLWYVACPAASLKRGDVVRRILFGEPVALGRTPNGEAFAIRDVCPHRAAPFSEGRIVLEDGRSCAECPYHGWRFDVQTGRCLRVPALSVKDDFDPAPIRVATFPVHEANGLIWIFNGRENDNNAKPPPPDLPAAMAEPVAATPKLVTEVGGEGPYDEAVIGLVDPAHTPFVHKQWWWREGRAAAEKTKTFEPEGLGFTMPAHAPSSNSRIYQMLGGAPLTEIAFRLPGLRIETIRKARSTIIGFTAITPTEVDQTQILHIIYWDLTLLTLMKPIAARMGDNFLSQDGAILRAQNRNLARGAHRSLFAGEPDMPAQWYFGLKKAWRNQQSAVAKGAAFENPLAPAALHWCT